MAYKLKNNSVLIWYLETYMWENNILETGMQKKI
jgi:hypothetical protein